MVTSIRGRVMKLTFLSGTVCIAAAVCQSAVADDRGIENLAPRQAVFAVTIPNWPAMVAGFERSPYGRIWQEPEIRKVASEWWKDTLEESTDEERAMTEELMELAREQEQPVGQVGMAMYIAEPAAEGAEDQPESGMHFLISGDFGQHAEATEARLLAFAQRQEERGRLELDEQMIGGVRVHSVKITIEPGVDEEEDPMDEEFGELGALGMEPPDIDQMLDSIQTRTMYIARADTMLLMGTQQEGLEAALDKLSGANRPHLAEEQAWSDAMAQHPRGGHVFGAVFINDALRAMLDSGEGDEMADSFLPVDPSMLVGTLGLKSVRAISLGLRLDVEVGGEIGSEQTVGVLTNEKKGLLALIDGEDAAFEPPAFIGGDVNSVSRFTLHCDKLIPLAEEVIKGMEPDMRSFFDMGVQQAKTLIGPALGAIGPEVYMATYLSRPFSTASESQVFAIRVRDELTVANAIAGIAPMGGLEPRDFQGATIYDGPEAPVAAGLGFGWLFLGDGPQIENAMRRAANPAEIGTDAIAQGAEFRWGVGLLGGQGRGSAQTWTNARQDMEFMIWGLKNPEELLKEELADFGLDEDELNQLLEDARSELPNWMKNLPGAEALTRHMGSTVSSYRSTPDGFRGTFLTLPPKRR